MKVPSKFDLAEIQSSILDLEQLHRDLIHHLEFGTLPDEIPLSDTEVEAVYLSIRKRLLETITRFSKLSHSYVQAAKLLRSRQVILKQAKEI